MLAEFYNSKEWRSLIKVLKNERINDRGELICQHCKKPIVKKYDCIGHHVKELTEENVSDASISLNPDNVIFVHHKCHNLIHQKLQHGRRSIYIVYGSPFSGKSSYVESVKNEGDLIVDMDSIWQCVSGCQRFTKPNRLNVVVFGVRDYLLDCIKYRKGKWLNAYVIGGYPLISVRERLAKELGAELVYIDTNKETCINRLMNQEERDKDEWKKFINDWWEDYSPPLDQ